MRRERQFVPQTEVTFAKLNDVVQSVLDETSDHRHGAFRCIRDYAVPAIRKPFELNELRWQRRRDVSLALDRMNRIVVPAHHQSGTLDAN